jgi:hypothetical protein
VNTEPVLLDGGKRGLIFGNVDLLSVAAFDALADQ